MRLLLDTRAFLWAQTDDPALSKPARERILEADKPCRPAQGRRRPHEDFSWPSGRPHSRRLRSGLPDGQTNPRNAGTLT
jgi:hypothetical protein